jgi:hypothetical protein
VVCLAPRALRDSVRPRRPADTSVRPLNFTVRRRQGDALPLTNISARAFLVKFGAGMCLATGFYFVFRHLFRSEFDYRGLLPGAIFIAVGIFGLTKRVK